MSEIEKLALLLASAIWDDDALHVEMTGGEKRKIDKLAGLLLIELGFSPSSETMADCASRDEAVAQLKEELEFKLV